MFRSTSTLSAPKLSRIMFELRQGKETPPPIREQGLTFASFGAEFPWRCSKKVLGFSCGLKICTCHWPFLFCFASFPPPSFCHCVGPHGFSGVSGTSKKTKTDTSLMLQ